MFNFETVQPGSWGNISTSVGYGFKPESYENNPVFVLTNEYRGRDRTLMLLDKKSNTLVWREDPYNKYAPFGTIDINPFLKKKMEEFKSIKKEDIDSETLDSMMKKAEEVRDKFLINCPEMKNFFFP